MTDTSANVVEGQDPAAAIQAIIDRYSIAGANLLMWLTGKDREQMPRLRRRVAGLLPFHPSETEIADWGNDVACRAAFAALREAKAAVAALQPQADAIALLREQIINTPETADFMAGVPIEAAHQRARWGSDHDAGKTPFDWFWLIGYLSQKAAAAQIEGDDEKARHHTISTAAALANWHAAISGASTTMRPGIDDTFIKGAE